MVGPDPCGQPQQRPSSLPVMTVVYWIRPDLSRKFLYQMMENTTRYKIPMRIIYGGVYDVVYDDSIVNS